MTIFMTWLNLFPNLLHGWKFIWHIVMYFQVCSNSAYPMHSGERYRTSGPLVSSPGWAYNIGRLQSVINTLQTSPQKPLGQSKPNFICSFHGSGVWKFVRGGGEVWVTWPRRPPSPYMVKNLFLWNQRASDLWLGMQHQELGPNKVCSNDDFFYGMVKFASLCFYMGKYTFLQEKC